MKVAQLYIPIPDSYPLESPFTFRHVFGRIGKCWKGLEPKASRLKIWAERLAKCDEASVLTILKVDADVGNTCGPYPTLEVFCFVGPN